MKKYIIIGVSGISLILVYLFLFGKLFPFSPVILGFEKYQLSNTDVFIQKGTSFKDFAAIDTLTATVENFHELKFVKKPEIFIFRNKSGYLRHSFSKARFCVYPSGRLFISPWALEESLVGKISLEIYLKHELSHVLIYQHTGFLYSLKYPKWLLEGIAVYSANQMGTSFYPGKCETYSAISRGNFLPPLYFKTKKEDFVRLDVKYRITFMYSEFACIVDYLISSYGKEKFIAYMKSLLENDDHADVFKRVYGFDFDSFILNFKNQVIENEKTN